MRHNYLLILLLSVGISSASSLTASTCTSVTNGSFTAPSVWDCGCSPLTCDTLVIAHTLTHVGDASWSNLLVHIEAAGALSVSGTLTLTGDLWNEGNLSADRLTLGDSANYMSNAGLLSGDNIYLHADSSLNSGEIQATDTVSIGLSGRFSNPGNCAGNFMWTACTTNSGNLVFEKIGADGNVDNTGMIRASSSMVVFDTLDNRIGAYLDVDSLFIGSALVTNGMMNARQWLRIYSYGALDLGQTGQVFCNGNLSNIGTIKGYGDLCIQGMSFNYGAITDSPDVCDISNFNAGPPYLDLNSGFVGSDVNWCPSANCSSLGAADVDRSPRLSAFPIPATDRIFVTGGSNGADIMVELSDLNGRVHPTEWQAATDGLTIYRAGLPSGTYLLRIVDRNASPRTVRIVFSEP